MFCKTPADNRPCPLTCRFCGGVRWFKPEEALEEAVRAGFLSSRELKPGVVVQTLPECLRSALRVLTSDASLRMRVV